MANSITEIVMFDLIKACPVLVVVMHGYAKIENDYFLSSPMSRRVASCLGEFVGVMEYLTCDFPVVGYVEICFESSGCPVFLFARLPRNDTTSVFIYIDIVSWKSGIK